MTGELIYAKMAAIAKEISPISKAQRNVKQNYNFRGIDDIYNMIQPLMAKHGVCCRISEILNSERSVKVTTSGTEMIYTILTLRYTFIASDGSEVTTTSIGEASDSGDKGSNKAMAAAHKYALIQTFCIPTHESIDTENDSPEFKSKPLPQQQTEWVYLATPDDKRELATALNARGIKDVQKQREISEILVGKNARQIKEFLETLIRNTQHD